MGNPFSKSRSTLQPEDRLTTHPEDPTEVFATQVQPPASSSDLPSATAETTAPVQPDSTPAPVQPAPSQEQNVGMRSTSAEVLK